MVRRQPRAAAAGLGHPVGRLLGRGRARAGSSRSATASWSASSSRLTGAGRRTSGCSRCARMDLGPRSMASVWMVGIEDRPERSGEICIFEVFGDALEDGVAAVGAGAPVPRSGAHRRVRRAADADRCLRPRLRRRLAAWPRRLPDRRPAGEDGPPGAGLPDADDGRGVRLPGEGRARTTCPSWPSTTSEEHEARRDRNRRVAADRPRLGAQAGRRGAPEAWLAFEPAFADALDGIAAGDELLVLTWLDRAGATCCAYIRAATRAARSRASSTPARPTGRTRSACTG